MNLQQKYDQTVSQGWIPIYVDDGRDALQLTEACVEAGINTIEVTCRRSGALNEIKHIKKEWPHLSVLVGSTVDNDLMANYVTRQKAPLPSLDQLADAGADGFVSIFPFSHPVIEKYRYSHLLIPGVSTLGEAYFMLTHGAHFAKMVLTPPETIGLYTSTPTHGIIPFLVTGNVTVDQVEDYVKNGAVLLAGGWDIILGGDSLPESKESCVIALRKYIEAVSSARNQTGRLVPTGGPYPWYHPFEANG